MTLILLCGMIALALTVAVIVNFGDSKDKRADTPIKQSYLLSHHEKMMFWEIHQAVPECQIFTQVAFSAILWTSSQRTRNRFNRLRMDFLVTDNDFNILAIIELDDKSHDNKKEQDKKRDAMLNEAGYKVLRYRNIPSKNQLRTDIINPQKA